MSTQEKTNIQRRVFTFFILVSSIAIALYTNKLVKDVNSHSYPMLYVYLRFFLSFWVISSIIISLFGEMRKIGGLKSLLISLFNPALGLIMVIASESKQKKTTVDVLKLEIDGEIEKKKPVVKNKAYSLNS